MLPILRKCNDSFGVQTPDLSERRFVFPPVPTGLYQFHEDTVNMLYVLSMPLAHKKSSMIFIMPYHLEPLDRLEKLLTRKQLDTWVGKLEERAVAVSLPKISMEVSHNLQVRSAPC